MKTSRISLLALASIIAAGTLAGSAQPSQAGGLGLGWLNNKPYVQCLQTMNFMADFNSGRPQSEYQRMAARERGRHICNRKYGYE